MIAMAAMLCIGLSSCGDDPEPPTPEPPMPNPITDYRQAVDLGLPSGTLWATCNVGANNPEEYGDYFAWGETTPKSSYSWSNYKHCQGSGTTMTKYCSDYAYGTKDNRTELEPADDAATANWGNDWQMPSMAQCQELCYDIYTTSTWTTVNGVYGRKITSKSNGQSIFLPAAGSRDGTVYHDIAGKGSNYWSRSLHAARPDLAGGFGFYQSETFGYGSPFRFYGSSVRPVRKK